MVLVRWEQQKKSATFEDDEDPLSDTDVSSVEGCIPLAFKLKVAKELYDSLSAEEKKAINLRREEDRKKLYRTIPQITDPGERKAKLELHERYLNLRQYTISLSNLSGLSGTSR